MVGRAVLGEPRLGETPRPTSWLTRSVRPIWLLVFKLDDLPERRHGRMNQDELNESNTRAVRALLGEPLERTNR